MSDNTKDNIGQHTRQDDIIFLMYTHMLLAQ